MQIKKLSGLFLAVAFVLSACGAPAVTPSATSAAGPTTVPPTALPHWTYEGAEGPEHWGDLPGYEVCKTGKSQSPLDLAASSGEDLANIVFHYQPSELRIVDNGHVIQANYDAGSYIEIGKERYDALQFHYHSPAEHTIGGNEFPAEFHIVHRNADGAYAVVGILLEEGDADNPAFDALINALPKPTDPVNVEKDAGVKFDATTLLPTEQITFRYTGSLTTPPCAEGVQWNVMVQPVEVSADQLKALEALHEHNNRPVQEQNERPVVEDTTP